MFQEISAAVDHLVTLLHPAIDTAGFKQHVHTALEIRFAHIWFIETPSRASASRVLLWHAHGGGEGLDNDLLQASRKYLSSDASLTDEELFSSPFTLWIDPGCVAIRLGLGPGLSFTSGPSLLTNIKTIFSQQKQTQQQHYPAPPLLALIPSTPALVQNTDQGWSEAVSFRNMFTHSRSLSSSSMTSSSVTGSRCTSQSGSYADEECPSLTVQDSDSELSIEDMIDSGCYKNFDIMDDNDDDEEQEQEPEDVGDETITEGMRLHHLGDASAAPASIINYDGGNVGVLGGGIRLGGAPTTKAPLALPAPSSLHGYEQSLGFLSIHQYTTMMEGYAIPMAKRIRSRGRRSRGRGAGRAARRQAAASASSSEVTEQYLPEQRTDGPVQDPCEDEKIMAIVRQRADRVAQDLRKRQSMQNLHQQYYPSQHHQSSLIRPSQQQQQQQQLLPQYNRPQQQYHHVTASHQLPIHPHQLQSYHSHATPLYQSLY